jgi:hypothetical protein
MRFYCNVMLLRMLLALTIALLPMPAVASCHAQPQVAAHHGMRHEPVKQMPAEQLCIGCVAPATARAPELSPPLGHARVDAPAKALSCAPLAGVPPATPPPQSEA